MSTSASGLNFGSFVYEYVIAYVLSSAVVSILDIYRNLYIQHCLPLRNSLTDSGQLQGHEARWSIFVPMCCNFFEWTTSITTRPADFANLSQHNDKRR